MLKLIARYTHWLHTKWPAGVVERLPESDEQGRTRLPGVRIVGDLTGVPLLKFSSKSGAEAVHAFLKEPDFLSGRAAKADAEPLDIAVIGAGVAGISAAIEAKRAGLKFAVFEAAAPFSTITNFPKGKPIYTYPSDLKLDGGLQFSTSVKEALVEELEAQRLVAGIETTQTAIHRVEHKGGVLLLHHRDSKAVTRARRVIIAIGRSGNFRKLGVPGEELPKVYNRLHDPKEYGGKNVLVMGGGDTAIETSAALTACGAHVTLSYRKREFSRPKPENVERLNALVANGAAPVSITRPTSERVTTAASSEMRSKATPPGSLTLALGTQLLSIEPEHVTLKDAGGAKETRIPNDVVFSMIGRDAPLDFFRRSGIPITGEWTPKAISSCLLFVVFCVFVYHFKSNHPHELPVQQIFKSNHWFPYNVPSFFEALGGQIAIWANSEGHLLHTLKRGLSTPSFYYTLAYCTLVTVFGIRRMQRRPTPYVRLQTWTLIAVQCLPLFILPEILLPWAGRNGWFEQGAPLRWLADQLFETYDGGIGHERAYWRAYGFILAFPLNVYNVFTEHPMWLWLGIAFVQTFVIIPLIIFRWGKGAYCGWICSCGALAETLGDTQRHKMPHGPGWNRLNMLGQATLLFALVLLVLRIVGWVFPGAEGTPSAVTVWFNRLFEGIPFLSYAWSVDIFLAGILGVGLYFWMSGRVWCRFACPLAALMHIYARFSRYRIFAEKQKCISCNVCTSVCHQGIDVMNFANKGMPMEDPECVRCSACVQQCPTGVLAFGRLDAEGHAILDKLPASPVQMAEARGK
jgi:NosR/NirI family nitrous oxide reductase transcriptional regulator